MAQVGTCDGVGVSLMILMSVVQYGIAQISFRRDANISRMVQSTLFHYLPNDAVGASELLYDILMG